MKKAISLLLCAALLLTTSFAGAEAGMQPPEMPAGDMPDGMPGGAPDGMPGSAPDGMPGGGPGGMPEGGSPGGMPGGAPDGMPGSVPGGMPGGSAPDGRPGGGPGGMADGAQGTPSQYDAVYTVEEDSSYTGEIESTGTDENAIHIISGNATVSGASVSRTSGDSTGGDAASFYGVGAAILATGGTLTVEDTTVSTDASGGAGVFAYGDAVVTVSNSTISTKQNTSGGIHVAGGGTLYANNLTVTTEGESAAAIRSDRGGGTMVVDGGSYTSNGVGSPAVYVTADITVSNAQLTATGSEALCMEGLNSVRLYNCDLSGDMDDLSQNDTTWTVIVYQSMSGDAQIGKGYFEMTGGSLTSYNGGRFIRTTNRKAFPSTISAKNLVSVPGMRTGGFHFLLTFLIANPL